jgi:hypothetical protein
MLKERCSVALLVVALSYLIVPPGVQERETSVRFEPQASMTQWKVLDEYASVASCERGREAVLFEASQLKSDDAIRQALAQTHSRASLQEWRQMFDAATLGARVARCVNAIGPGFEHTDLL